MHAYVLGPCIPLRYVRIRVSVHRIADEAYVSLLWMSVCWEISMGVLSDLAAVERIFFWTYLDFVDNKR